MNNNSKGFTPILIVIILGIIGIVGYLFFTQSIILTPTPSLTITPKPTDSPTPTPTSSKPIFESTEDWETYSNPVYDFAIGFPPGYRPVMGDCSRTETPPSRCNPVFELIEKQSGCSYCPLIVIRITPDNGELLEEYARVNFAEDKTTYLTFNRQANVELNEIAFKAKKAFVTTADDVKYALISQHKGRFYRFEPVSYNNGDEIFDQILSTFEFLE